MDEAGPSTSPTDYGKPYSEQLHPYLGHWGKSSANYSIMDIPFDGKPGGDLFFSDRGYLNNPTAYSDGYSGYPGGNISNLTNIWEREVLAPDEKNTPLEWMRDIALGVVLAMLSLLTFVGNAMVLHAVRTERRLQSVSNMFIVSLAIADLIVGLIVMPISAIYIFTVDWLFGVGICQFWMGVDYTASTASILNLFILSLDRYWSVTSPLKYIRQRTKRRALIMISLAWFASSLWIIPIIGWHFFEHNGVRSVPADVCDTEYATNTALKIVTGLFNFYLPLAIMYALYGKIFIEIKRRSKMEFGQRIAGGNGVETYVTNSLSEDSDDKQFVDAIPLKHSAIGELPQNGKPTLGRTISQMSSCSYPRTDMDTDTDQTDDDAARLHRGGYTNMTLVRVAAERAQAAPSPPDVCSSDSDYNRVYVYDESVLESTTEKVHRYFYQHQSTQKNALPEGAVNSDHVDSNHVTIGNGTDEVRNGNGRVRFQIDQSEYEKSSIALPKETHPAKNTYVVKPKCYHNTKLTAESDADDGVVSSPGVSPKLNRNPSSISNQQRVQKTHHSGFKHQPRHHYPPANSALVKQAMRWRRKIDKKKHKPSSALSKEIKAARQLGVIMGAFTVCFLPYFVCFMVVAFCDKCVDPALMTAVTWIGYLNSTLNPFLYPLCNANFRRKFREMLHLSSDFDRRRHSVYYTPSRNMSTAAGCDM